MRYHAVEMDYILRKATLSDRAVAQLIKDSARSLSRVDYSDEQIEGAIATVFGVGTNLIIDGTYFVAESFEELIGCGGWRKRQTLFGGDQYATREAGYLDPRQSPQRFAGSLFIPCTQGRKSRERFSKRLKLRRQQSALNLWS